MGEDATGFSEVARQCDSGFVALRHSGLPAVAGDGPLVDRCIYAAAAARGGVEVRFEVSGGRAAHPAVMVVVGPAGAPEGFVGCNVLMPVSGWRHP
ncbi:hypothetical protein TcBrA4_0072690 [Trypanosoma cruzi]|nr:hypothetical protein TcBrA4_0072690 [Trypanosoma cruzi]